MLAQPSVRLQPCKYANLKIERMPLLSHCTQTIKSICHKMLCELKHLLNTIWAKTEENIPFQLEVWRNNSVGHRKYDESRSFRLAHDNQNGVLINPLVVRFDLVVCIPIVISFSEMHSSLFLFVSQRKITYLWQKISVQCDFCLVLGWISIKQVVSSMFCSSMPIVIFYIHITMWGYFTFAESERHFFLLSFKIFHIYYGNGFLVTT